jgi:protein-S-isoprenylcysteine O-methyltransferase Ste14
MKTVLPFIAVVIFVLLPLFGVTVAHQTEIFFGVVVPYAAVAVFVLGFIYRVLQLKTRRQAKIREIRQTEKPEHLSPRELEEWERLFGEPREDE